MCDERSRRPRTLLQDWLLLELLPPIVGVVNRRYSSVVDGFGQTGEPSRLFYADVGVCHNGGHHPLCVGLILALQGEGRS